MERSISVKSILDIAKGVDFKHLPVSIPGAYMFLVRLSIFTALALAAPTLLGCTIHSIDCSLGTPHVDCAKGTIGHEAAQDVRRAGETTATVDDARCRSYGFTPGQPNYSQCRADIERQRTSPAR